jgi:DNA polymerase (family 10)
MRGTCPEPIRLPLARAEKIADKIVGELAEFCSLDAEEKPRIVVAGSIRRRRPECGDIDLVCLPRDEWAREALKARARKTNPWTLVDGPQQFRIALDIQGGPVQVDFWFASHPERHMFGEVPGNWGSLLLFATGSGRHNVWIVQRAKEKGMAWKPYAGLWLGQHCQASDTEEEIYRGLGLDYLPPEDRER